MTPTVRLCDLLGPAHGVADHAFSEAVETLAVALTRNRGAAAARLHCLPRALGAAGCRTRARAFTGRRAPATRLAVAVVTLVNDDGAGSLVGSLEGEVAEALSRGRCTTLPGAHVLEYRHGQWGPHQIMMMMEARGGRRGLPGARDGHPALRCATARRDRSSATAIPPPQIHHTLENLARTVLQALCRSSHLRLRSDAFSQARGARRRPRLLHRGRRRGFRHGCTPGHIPPAPACLLRPPQILDDQPLGQGLLGSSCTTMTHHANNFAALLQEGPRDGKPLLFADPQARVAPCHAYQ